MNYEYTRELMENGEYNINNPFDVNLEGKSVTLFYRILEALPNQGLTDVSLSENIAIVTMNELSPENKTILDNTVAAHKVANGTINYETEIHITSPDGTIWDIVIANDGSLSTRISDE